eukprot:COSAG05_NODE_4892_length_1334_cov_1.794332_1_plen_120_part_00
MQLLQRGGDDAEDTLTSALEHALQALEGLPMSTPRKVRKAALALCERVETALDDEANSELVRQLMLSNASQLATLATALCEVRSLTVGENDGMEVVECVGALLDELARCGDVVLGAHDC